MITNSPVRVMLLWCPGWSVLAARLTQGIAADQALALTDRGVVVACSALKQKYRDVMRVAAYGSPSVQIHFIYLKLDEQVLLERVKQRSAHYMKSSMVRSQLLALEEPEGEWDASTIDVKGDPEDVQRKVFEVVDEKLAEHQ